VRRAPGARAVAPGWGSVRATGLWRGAGSGCNLPISAWIAEPIRPQRADGCDAPREPLRRPASRRHARDRAPRRVRSGRRTPRRRLRRRRPRARLGRPCRSVLCEGLGASALASRPGCLGPRVHPIRWCRSASFPSASRPVRRGPRGRRAGDEPARVASPGTDARRPHGSSAASGPAAPAVGGSPGPRPASPIAGWRARGNSTAGPRAGSDRREWGERRGLRAGPAAGSDGRDGATPRSEEHAGGRVVGPTAVDDAPRSLPPEKAAGGAGRAPVVSDAVGVRAARRPTDPGRTAGGRRRVGRSARDWDDVTPAVGATFPVAAAPDRRQGRTPRRRDDSASRRCWSERRGSHASAARLRPRALAGRGESADRERE
jgi:hypothetical protein